MSMPIDLSTINQLETDFTAASVVAALIDEGKVAADRINIAPAGADRNAYSKEIKSIQGYHSDSLRQDKLMVQVNREGFYDMLPEGLFHGSPKFQERTSKEKMISDVRKWREEERLARQFFMPFEAEVYQVRTMMHRYENRLDKKLDFREFPKLLAPLWPELNMLSAEQCVVWMHIIPLIPAKRNDLVFLESVVEALFRLSCQAIRQANRPALLPIPPQQQYALGKGKLGVDTLIGRQVVAYQDTVVIRLAQLAQDAIQLFMPNCTNRIILEKFCQFLLPVDAVVDIQLVGVPKDSLGGINDQFESPLLSYNSHLSTNKSLHL